MIGLPRRKKSTIRVTFLLPRKFCLSRGAKFIFISTNFPNICTLTDINQATCNPISQLTKVSIEVGNQNLGTQRTTFLQHTPDDWSSPAKTMALPILLRINSQTFHVTLSFSLLFQTTKRFKFSLKLNRRW